MDRNKRLKTVWVFAISGYIFCLSIAFLFTILELMNPSPFQLPFICMDLQASCSFAFHPRYCQEVIMKRCTLWPMYIQEEKQESLFEGMKIIKGDGKCAIKYESSN